MVPSCCCCQPATDASLPHLSSHALVLSPPAAQCAQLSAAVAAAQAEASRQMEALKEGLARELRKQKASLLPCCCGIRVVPAALPGITLSLCPALPSPQKQDVWVASERAKREAWMAEQTRAIKESTVRGLEPEIQVRDRAEVWPGLCSTPPARSALRS